jgi:nitroreductase
MDFYSLISQRNSVRNFDPSRKVEPDILHRILEAGRLAPSAVNFQPWQFWVISSPEMLKKVKACYNLPWFQDAPQVLTVVGDLNQAWVRKDDGYSSIETDLTIAMCHLILAAENEGVATCWIQAFKPDLLRDALSLKENQRIFAMTPLGYPKADFTKQSNKQRKPLAEIVRFI